jgi:beta-N-acetylhexosaminidase
MKKNILTFLAFACFFAAAAQYKSKLPAPEWVDSVFKSLGPDEKIAQLMVVRAFSTRDSDIVRIGNLVKKYNVGSLCFFQGGPVRQANATNYYQSLAKTPLLVTIDGEWGLGMRLDSVYKFPFQLTLGALSNDDVVYKMGLAVGRQCKRIGVHVNFAPVVDINNNPKNPVIGYRSFGEDIDKVTRLGIAYMKGMQDAGIMACAKHFPGHGDTEVDSHYDLPVINKSMSELSALELKPFEAIFNAGVGSVMIAHLYIPSIDNTANTATSLSKNNVTKLLRDQLKFSGLTFTDALEMKGVSKFWPGGEAAVQALIAGNDMLCLPESVPDAIEAIKKAIRDKRLTWADIDSKVKKVLVSKYNLGLHEWTPVETKNLLEDLNAETNRIRYAAAQQSLTVLSLAYMKASRNDYATIPLEKGKKVAYVGIGCSQLNDFGRRMQEEYNADVFLFSYKDGESRAAEILKSVPPDGKYDAIIVGIHDFSNRPANNYGIPDAAIHLWKKLNFIKTITLVFGNVFATSNFCDAWTLAACYQDDEITQQAAADLITGEIVSMGRLPVSVCKFKYGEGIVHGGIKPIKASAPVNKFNRVDSIIENALVQKVFPGCVVLAAKNGEIVYQKAFGNISFNSVQAVTAESIFDLASVTKISATTLSVMKLYEQGKLDMKKKLGDYLSWVKGTDKAGIVIEDLLLHRAGLVPFIPFYKETIDTVTGIPFPTHYSSTPSAQFSIRVAENLYLRNDWQDTIISRILKSPLGPKGKYVYSDNDFIFLGKIVEALSGTTLADYVQKTFYRKMGLLTMGYKPLERFAVSRIVPTEDEKHFRRQLLWGDVHDEGASLFGGVAGHAGLFSNAYDLAMLYQMLLNGGTLSGERFLKAETIKKFTAYGTKDSRRGLGFDKPERPARLSQSGGDNATRKDPYPSALASPETFGHTGFTGTCVWVDPKYNLVYIFLSNRVNPTRNNPLLSRLRIRENVMDAIIEVIR